MSPPPRIALVGYRGTGKSAVGRALAAVLGWDFLDADAELERRSGRTISDLFTAVGESGFRDRESALLTELLRPERRVIATGGGVILRESNQPVLRENTYVAWLTAPPDILWQRIITDPATATRRPNLTPAGGRDEVVALLADREPLYRAVADGEFPTAERSPEQVADDILAAWRLSSCSRSSSA